jgi:hypothetical protein
MIVSICNMFAGPIRAEVIGAYPRGRFTRVRVRSVCNAKGYRRGYVFDVPFYDVYLKHKFVGYHVEYLGRPRLEDLPVINPEETP